MQMIKPDKRATRDHPKLHNKRLIFASIYQNEQVSRVKIAHLTDLMNLLFRERSVTCAGRC